MLTSVCNLPTGTYTYGVNKKRMDTTKLIASCTMPEVARWLKMCITIFLLQTQSCASRNLFSKCSK